MGDFKAAKDAFNKLKVDPQSAAFAEEILDKKLLVRLQKSKYSWDKQFFKNVNFQDKKSVIFNPESVNERVLLKKEILILPLSIVLVGPLN